MPGFATQQKLGAVGVHLLSSIPSETCNASVQLLAWLCCSSGIEQLPGTHPAPDPIPVHCSNAEVTTRGSSSSCPPRSSSLVTQLFHSTHCDRAHGILPDPLTAEPARNGICSQVWGTRYAEIASCPSRSVTGQSSEGEDPRRSKHLQEAVVENSSWSELQPWV